jgi:hypothetical protein
MTMKFVSKTMDIGKIVVDTDKNVRLDSKRPVAGLKFNTYELGSMIDAIIQKKGICTALVLNYALSVLQGFRRALAGQEIQRNPDKYFGGNTELRDEVLANLRSVPVLVYSKDLSEEEELDLINDHGDRKGIGAVEFILAVWHMLKQGRKEAQISLQLLYAAAEYTGNVQKIKELPEVGSLARAEKIRSWLHGTIGNYIIAAYYMGDRVKDAMLRTAAIQDGLSKADDKDSAPLFYAKRTRINQLNSAITQDKGKGLWDDVVKTGPAFEAKLAEFIKEDAGEGPVKVADTRKSVEDVKGMINSVYLSKAFKTALKVTFEEVNEAPRVDEETARMETVFSLLETHLDEIANPLVKDVIVRVLHATPSDLETFLKAESVTAPSGTTSAVTV